MLLSDLWSSRLIDPIRRISTLNNSFPSLTSQTVVIGVTRAAGSRPRAMVNFVLGWSAMLQPRVSRVSIPTDSSVPAT
jgi:hypothetical protein